jgi:DNA-binding transcriptional ArsR family regulator
MPGSSHATERPLDPTARRSSGDPSAGVAVVQRGEAAEALLDPMRRRILESLRGPGSATTVARDLGLSRQLANYHVRALEKAGLVEEVGRRPRRGLEERIVRATASHYLIAPDALTPGGTAAEATDRFSATYQVAVAARTIREVASLAALAREAGKRLTTLTIDTELRFASPAVREAFANELTTTIQTLVAKYHDEHTAGGRAYRLFLGAHPVYREPAPSPDPPTVSGRAVRKRRQTPKRSR